MTTKRNASNDSLLNDDWLTASSDHEPSPTIEPRAASRRESAPPANDDWLGAEESTERPKTAKAPAPTAVAESPRTGSKRSFRPEASGDDWLGDLDPTSHPKGAKADRSSAPSPEQPIRPARTSRRIVSLAIAWTVGVATGLALAFFFRPAPTPVVPPTPPADVVPTPTPAPAPTPTPAPIPPPQPVDPPHRHPNPFNGSANGEPPRMTGMVLESELPVPPKPEPTKPATTGASNSSTWNMNDYLSEPPPPRR